MTRRCGRCGLSFLKSTCRGCRRHLAIWLAVFLCLYSLFYVTQYIVVDSDQVGKLRRHQQDIRHHDVTQPHSDIVPTLPTWGNVSGLKEHIKPVLMDYSRALKKRGSRTEFTLPWDMPEVDYRITACQDTLNVNITAKATIIIHLHGARIEKALPSLFSIIKLTNINLVEGVILIGDIGLPGIYRDIYELFPDYLPTFRLFISPKRTTVTQARKFAAKFAHGDVLVFLESLVVVTNQWLDFLMAAILKNPNSVIQPIIITNDTELDESGRPIFIMKKELQLDLTLTDIKTPIFPNHFLKSFQKESIVSSSVFAMRKVLYNDLRELEEYSGFTDLEMIVMSLKAWMCGGGVLLAPCSCVVLQSQPPLNNQSSAVATPVNKNLALKRKRHLLFISSVWFPPYDNVYQCLLPKSRQIRLSYTDKRSIKLYKLFYTRLNCRKFTEFVKLVQPNLTKPRKHASNHGTLTLQGHDLSLTRSSDGSNLLFVSNLAPLTLPFTYSNFSISINNMCITHVPNTSIRLTVCQRKNVNQQWHYKNSQIQLKRNPHLCIVKQRNSTTPSVNLCKNVNVMSRFNFTLSFEPNCIK